VQTGILIQVRLHSTRLARKAILPLPGGFVIEHVMRALAEVPADVRVLVTDEESSGILLPLAAREGYEVFPGPRDDVLLRYCRACRVYGVDRVVRATGDNPLTSGRLARDLIELHERVGADMSHHLGNPWGTGVEIVEASALFEAEQNALQPDEREHITTYLYRHRERFAIAEPHAPADANLPDGRVTIDTTEDYERVKLIFASLYRGTPPDVGAVVDWLRTHAGTEDAP
jgi:spore coat polysaccharide biosynthesis protein SpsF